MKKKIFFAAIIFVFSLFFNFVYGAIDQTYVERILKENRDFIAFIDEIDGSIHSPILKIISPIKLSQMNFIRSISGLFMT